MNGRQYQHQLSLGLGSGPATRSAAPEGDAGRLERSIAASLGEPVRLVLHDNRSTMVSFRREAGGVQVRLHRVFLQAPGEVVGAVSEFVRTRSPEASGVVTAYLREVRIDSPPPVRPAPPLRVQGSVHHLGEILAALNARSFDGRIDARIGWGRGSKGGGRRSLRLGAYHAHTRTILVHPALDRAEVPRFFVEWVVFHEMLHQDLPATMGLDGRRCLHPPAFRARERAFHDYERARAWERRHLGLLLDPPRPGA